VVFWDLDQKKEVRSFEGVKIGDITWSPGGKYIVCCCRDQVVRFWSASTGRHQGSLMMMEGGAVLTVSPEGHWAGSEGVEKRLVYQAQTEKTTRDYKPQEFAKEFKWKNDPSKVRLLGR
jgi:WD40 repeat protein